MSQALESLNSILKYRQERERQKINESMAMLEMGSRLKQQQYDREVQEQSIILRDAQEKRTASKNLRDIALYDKEVEAANLELKKLRRSESPENIALEEQKKENELRQQQLSLQYTEQQLKTSIEEKSDKNFNEVIVALDVMKNNKNEDILNSLKTSGIIPQPVFNVIQNDLIDGDFANNDIKDIKRSIKDSIKKTGLMRKTDAQGKYLTALMDSPYADSIIAGIAQVDLSSKKGTPQYEILMESLNDLYVPMMRDREFLITMQNSGVDINKFNNTLYANAANITYSNYIEDATNSGELKKAINRLTSRQIDKDIKNVTDLITEQYFKEMDGNITDEERMQLLNEGFTEDQID